MLGGSQFHKLKEVMDCNNEESMMSCSKLSVSFPFAVPRKARTKPLRCKRRLDFDDTSFLGKRSRVNDEMGFSESTQQDSNLNARIIVPINDLGKQKEETPEPPLEIGYSKNKEQDEPKVFHKCSTLLQPNVGSASEHVSIDDREEIMVGKNENMKDSFVVGPPTPSPTRRKRAKPTVKIQKNKMEEISELVAHSHYLTRSIMDQVVIAIETDKVKMVSHTRRGCVQKLRNKRVSPNSKNQLSLTKDAHKAWQALMKKAMAESCDTVLEKEFHRKVKSFISKVGTIQGKRDYSPWKGSVLDSVIGALLTQRVGDNFSSSAFMELGVIFSQDRDCVAYGRHHRMLRDQRIKGGRICHNQDKKGNGMKLSAHNKESLDEKKMKNSIKGKVSGKRKLWNTLRMQYGSVDIERTIDTVDYVDWNAVRRAKVEDISDAILLRGMNIKLADRIKEFLDRLMKDHGNLDLEWVRNVPPLKAKKFLLSIYGLGPKSVGCVQLLTLKQPAFPVDVNVARVTVRLGWVPIPENTSDKLLMSVLDESSKVHDLINQYLWPRLSELDHNTLYELHYQMITFGKVFCTKNKPSCADCPMRKECKSYADIDIEDSDGMGRLITQRMLTRAKGGSSKSKLRGQEGPVKKKDQTHFTLGGIEAPKTPAKDESHQKPRSHKEKNTHVSSSTGRKPKKSRTRTQHCVYELPDWHPILETFDDRTCDDPSPYLLLVWESGDPLVEITPPSGLSYRKWSETVRGTVMIPYMTALRGNFPLNGTYFQTNEVFADHKTTQVPIDVRCKTLQQLKKTTLYCGSNLSKIVTGLSAGEVKRLFNEGYICTRGFDREKSASVALEKPLYTSSQTQKTKTITCM